MSHEPRTVLRLSDVTRQLRDHFREHGQEDGCDECRLWLIYTRGLRRGLDDFIANRDGDTYPLKDLVGAARTIRSGWGEGDWTNP